MFSLVLVCQSGQLWGEGVPCDLPMMHLGTPRGPGREGLDPPPHPEDLGGRAQTGKNSWMDLGGSAQPPLGPGRAQTGKNSWKDLGGRERLASGRFPLKKGVLLVLCKNERIWSLGRVTGGALWIHR